jgi:hypothetical protein
MKTIIQRLCRLEERSGIGNPDAIEQTRRLIEGLEAGRRRAAEARARVECDYQGPDEDGWKSLVGLTRVEILQRGRQRGSEVLKSARRDQSRRLRRAGQEGGVRCYWLIR